MSNSDGVYWVPDENEVFVKAELIKTENNTATLRNVITGATVEHQINDIYPVNPILFDKSSDVSELTYLNEPSVLYNLQNRYMDDLIYTYSGLFLVAINPYKNLQIYSDETIKKYHNAHTVRGDEENSLNNSLEPHIYKFTENAYQKMISNNKDQSILVTGESGAGKTENTKKILQYLTSITTTDTSDNCDYELKILQSNPILESFGNSQTIKNNNSSRFGKFIKIFFDHNQYNSIITGTQIDWYLLEKSRVIRQAKDERNFHIFYELLEGLKGSYKDLQQELKIESTSASDFLILNDVKCQNDLSNFENLMSAFEKIDFDKNEILDFFKVISTILHMGNLVFKNSTNLDKAAVLENPELTTKIAELLGLSNVHNDFENSILRPKSKAGKEWVSKQKNSKQAKAILDALSKNLYENLFNHIVKKINEHLTSGRKLNTSENYENHFIGLLDIAGFEIFQRNSFEQFCINYTNEKLQQFFNNHMFVLEQNEYLDENIEWDYINFGKSLQLSINLIELKNASPIGILPLLDEESIIPNSSDDSFYSKLVSNLEQAQTKNDRFKRSKKMNSFILKHYAGDVEYDTDGWLSKNRDPLNEHLLSVLAKSENKLISSFYNNAINQDTINEKSKNGNNSMKATASLRHREQLSSLLEQLKITDPHFVRCIIPNRAKISHKLDKALVLDQLRCNGVLEGIRIAREGYPNRVVFKEFFQRYKFLLDQRSDSSIDISNVKQNCEVLLSTILEVDPTLYKVGNTKLFFKAGVLADLETKVDEKLSTFVLKLNSIIRGNLLRRVVNEKLEKYQSLQIIGNGLASYQNEIKNNIWFDVLKRKPLATSSHDILKTRRLNDSLKRIKEELHFSKDEKLTLEKENKEKDSKLAEIQSLLDKGKNELQESQHQLAQSEQNETKLSQQIENLKNWNLQLEEQKQSLENDKREILNKFELFKTDSENSQVILKEEFESEKSNLENTINKLKLEITASEESNSKLKESEEQLNELVKNLKQTELKQQKDIKSLKVKLTDTEHSLDSKLSTLEKNCNSALTRLKTLINENKELRKIITTLQDEKESLSEAIKRKDSELNAIKKQLNIDSEELKNALIQKEEAAQKCNLVMSELANMKHDMEGSLKRNRQLEQEVRELENEIKSFSHADGKKFKDLESRLAQEQSVNTYLNSKLESINATKNLSGDLQNSINRATEVNRQDILKTLEEYKFKFNEQSKVLEERFEEEKNLISKLRFTETKLAATTMNLQNANGQLRKLKESLRQTNGNENKNSENKFESISNDFENEKLVLEVQHLKRQLEIETKARYDAEKSNKLPNENIFEQESIASHNNSYKSKFEANEEKVKYLQDKLSRATPLKDKTNNYSTPGSIFMDRAQSNKFEDEVKFHKLENYKLQEILNDSDQKINNLMHSVKQSNAKEILLKDQIKRMEHDLMTTEDHNEHLTSTLKQQKVQYDQCVKDLQENEFHLREVSHALSQAEEDVKSMAEIITKLKATNKEKDTLLWKKEDEKVELDLQLEELSLEHKKTLDLVNRLTSDLDHFKARVVESEDNSAYIEEIETLKTKLQDSARLETEQKKEISTLKYSLKILQNETESRTSELLKQNDYYVTALEQLNSEKDSAIAAEQEIDKEYALLNNRAVTLSNTVDDLLNEKESLTSELVKLKQTLEESTSAIELSHEVETNLSNENAYLKETLKLKTEQSERNEEFTEKLQNELTHFKTLCDDERKKNIVNIEELETIHKQNELLTINMKTLEAQLADPTQKNAWLSKIDELQRLVNLESETKYEEMKKNKILEKQLEELTRLNEKQSEVIAFANEDRDKSEKDFHHYSETIENYEKQLSKQQLDMNKMIRDNSYFENKVDELEREIKYWKERFSSLSTSNNQMSFEQGNLLI